MTDWQNNQGNQDDDRGDTPSGQEGPSWTPPAWSSPSPESTPTPGAWTAPGSAAGGEGEPPQTPPSPPAPPMQPPVPPPGAYGSGSFQPPSANPQQTKREFHLGPLTVADILDTTFQLMKANWKQISLAVLVYAIPAGLFAALINVASGSNALRFNSGELGLFTGYSDSTEDLSGARTALVLLGTLLTLSAAVLLQPYVQGAVTRIVASSYLGREMSAGEALRGVLKLWPSFVGATILVGLSIMCGAIAFLIGAVVVWVLFTAVVPIIAIEEEGAFNALGRSWALMKKRFWSYLGARILITIITTIVSFAVILIPAVLANLFAELGADPVGWLVYTAGSVLAEIIVFPIGAIACTLIYFDSRVRNEGFDVQFMAARLQAPAAPTPDAQPPYSV